MKGIILAAGRGTRLYPMTKAVAKPLLPVYDKPLIYYSVATMLMAGVREIMIIAPMGGIPGFLELFGNGSHLGVEITYKEQLVPRGIADAFRIGEDFIGDDDVCLLLGDNIFHSEELPQVLRQAADFAEGAVVFGYPVDDPRPFGVVEFDDDGNAVSIEEKPETPKSDYIIPGLYFYDNQVVEIAKNLLPSARGELEITDVNLEYLRRGQLRVLPLSVDTLWLDAGNADALLDSGVKVSDIQRESGKLVGCPEETAYNLGLIDREQLKALGEQLKMTSYGKYLLDL